jgi:formylglycine-generating enzyme required for sulfatase activity
VFPAHAVKDLGSEWIYHAEHSYQYASGTATDSIYLYDTSMEAWIWTSEAYYPNLYKFGENAGWYTYQKGGIAGDRWFFNLGSETFRHESEMNAVPVVEIAMVRVEGGQLPNLSGIGPLNVSTFDIGKFEVTYGEWRVVRDWAVNNGYDLEDIGIGCDDETPVSNVNWFDCIKWCNAASEMQGLTPVYTYESQGVINVYRRALRLPIWNLDADGYRLPSTFEWEFAARGGNLSQGYTYAGGDTPGPVAWFLNNSSNAPCPLTNGNGYENAGPRPVGRKAANELGIHDMSGNVEEWNWEIDPTTNADRYLRGGAYTSLGLIKIRAAIGEQADFRDVRNGFRVVRNVTE